MYDTDDEVRDRATFYHRILSSTEAAQKLMVERLPVPLQNLEHDLTDYLREENPGAVFDVKTVATTAIKGTELKSVQAVEAKKKASPLSAPPSGSPAGAKRSESIPELEPFGLGLKLASSRVIEVTESEAAFPVSVVKHLFPKHLVLQFTVVNTLEEGFLKNVSVAVATKSSMFITFHLFFSWIFFCYLQCVDQFKVVEGTKLPSLSFEESANVFVIIARPSASESDYESLPVASFFPKLLYCLHEVDVKVFHYERLLLILSLDW